LPEVVVQERSDSLVSIAESASQGIVGAKQLEERPILRPGEVLETVPGLIVTQHSGDGKANQYFLRGFNLDHGTDFATKVNGVPVNLPTHAHGQGYTDLNFMIPELVQSVNYRKGVYYADEGDFSSAGAANLQYFNVLPKGLALATVGMYDYYRGLVADSPKVGRGHLLYAGEILFNNGPWDHPAGFLKGNAVLGYSMGDSQTGWSVTGMAYAADWDSTDQVASRAVNNGEIDRFGSLNISDGGNSQRYSFSGQWHRAGENSMTRMLAFGYYYELDLFSDFTYYLNDPVNGDQFEQQDKRWVSGVQASHQWSRQLGRIATDNTIGLQVRNDVINNGLFHTTERERLSTTRSDHVVQTSVSPYAETGEQWTDWFRSVAGLRLDIYHFDVQSELPDSSGNVTDAIANPKLSLIFGPWAKTEFYLNGGMGFHSNDGRGTTAPVDPVDPLVRTYGAEIGIRTTWVPNLQSTLAFWWLNISSELLFVGDAGTTEASRPSNRYGVEWANYYSPTKWLTLDGDFAFTHARFTDSDPAGNYIPGSPDAIIAAGLTVHDLRGFFGALRLRFFGPRPLTEDDSVTSDPTLLLNAQVGYQFNKTWTLSAEVFNLLNRKDSDISYYYPSRLSGEPPGPDDGGYNDIHFHPVEPISVRVTLTARF
jgi:outer membrane receptor protein involved in Fe transport